MEDWKTVGVVPDSDDDDADLTFPGKIPITSTASSLRTDTGAIHQSDSEEDELALPAPTLPGVSAPTSQPDKRIRTRLHVLIPRIIPSRSSSTSPQAISIESSAPSPLQLPQHPSRSEEGHVSSEDVQREERDEPKTPLGPLPSSPHFAGGDLDSSSDSPLSSISSASINWTEEDDGRGRAWDVGVVPASPVPPVAVLFDDVAPSRTWGLSRNFRRRNPIQLHPYMLEAERYKQTMHARGIRAVKLPNGIGNGNGKTQENSDEGDTQEFQPGSQGSVFASQGAEDETSQHVSETQGTLDAEQINVNPSAQEISLTRLKRPKKKRRISNHTGLQMDRAKILKSSKVDARRMNSQGLLTPGQSDNIDSPRSVTPQVRALPADRRGTNGFRLPPLVRSLQPQTPAKSSDRPESSPQALASSPPDSPDVVPLSASRRRRALLSDDSDDANDVGDSDGSELSSRRPSPRTATLPLKGVLPASWVTINLEKAKDAKHDRKRTQVNGERQRGVARPIKSRPDYGLTGNHSLHDSLSAIPVSDDDPSSSAPEDRNKAPEVRQDASTLEGDTQQWPDVDDMEDNDIDVMAHETPARRRKRKSLASIGPRKRLQQTRLTDHVRQTRPKFVADMKRKPKRLGILDREAGFRNLPRFLRVAARITRSRPDKGRSSPSRKAFKLHDQRDDREVQQTLQEWIHMEEEETDYGQTTESRVPFRDVSGNRQPVRPGRQDRVKAVNSGASRVASVKRKKAQANEQRLRSASRMDDALKYAAQKAEILNSMQSQKPIAQEDASRQQIASRRFVSNVLGHVPAVPGQLASAFVADTSKASAIRFSKSAGLASLPEAGADALEADRRSTDPGDMLGYALLEEPRRRVSRKRQPRQLQLPRFEDLAILNVGDSVFGLSQASTNLNDTRYPRILKGLERADLRPENFSIFEPLPSGRHFPQTSYLGSGMFADCVNPRPQSNDVMISVSFPPRTNLISWNSDVRTDITDRVKTIRKSIQDATTITQDTNPFLSQAVKMLEAIADLIRHRISFADHVDLPDFLDFCSDAMQDVYDSNFQHEGNVQISPTPPKSTNLLQISVVSRLVLIVHQLEAMSRDAVVPDRIRRSCRQRLILFLTEGLRLLHRGGMSDLRNFAERHRNVDSRDCLEHDNSSRTAEAFVMMACVAKLHEVSIGTLWEILDLAKQLPYSKTSQTTMYTEVASLEQVWREVFTLLLVLDIDVHGIKDSASSTTPNWALVRELCRPAFEAYRLNTADDVPRFIQYCKILLQRCFGLIVRWNWARSDSIIGFLFDFFARNEFTDLRTEAFHHSPVFLEQLKDGLRLVLESNDSCFHIFLKIIGAGITILRTTAPEKKIRDLIWRLIPNHGRRHSKNEEIDRNGLDATRNHHDLLCTLFWAAPVAHRPGIRLFQDLVEDEGSHEYVYHVNIQTWSNLAQYQIRSDSTCEALKPLADWAADILGKLTRQHALAKTETEAQVQQYEADNGRVVDLITQKHAIESNQKTIENIIERLLCSISDAVGSCPSFQSALVLIPSTLTCVLENFDINEARVNRSIKPALELVQAILSKKSDRQNIPQEQEEDSQGFDWSVLADIDDLCEPIHPPQPEQLISDKLYSAVHALLSTIFSADQANLDELLDVLVEVWATISKLSASTGLRTWDNYLGPYGRDSWLVMTESATKKRYTPYYYAIVLRDSPDVLVSHFQTILEAWLESLVDREAQVKYQAEFTAQLLNHKSIDPLLLGLPFIPGPGGKYAITLETFLQRRVVTLEAIFSNMRIATTPEVCPRQADRQQRVQEYKTLLEQIMTAMKRRYEELGTDPNRQNNYVEFVHTVVKLLQQHVQDICPVDPFFTSSAEFPLPDSDPLFMSSKLRGYDLRLDEERTPKQLAMFLQASIERNLYDGQGDRMVCHLVESSHGRLEQGSRLTLRSFVLRCLLPAYARQLSDTSKTQPFLLLVLRATESILEQILEDVDTCDLTSIQSATRSLEAAAFSACLCLQGVHILQQDTGFEIKVFLRGLAVVERVMHIVDYFIQLNQDELMSSLIGIAWTTRRFCRTLQSTFTSEVTSQMPEFGSVPWKDSGGRERDVQDFMLREIKRSLERTKVDSHGFWMQRSREWKLVIPKDEDSDMKEQLLDASEKFDRTLRSLPALVEAIEMHDLSVMLASMSQIDTRTA